MKAKSDTSIASSSTGDTCCSDLGSRSRSLEAVTGLPLWSSEYAVVDLVKGDYGLGFSILDYQVNFIINLVCRKRREINKEGIGKCITC